MNVKNVPLRDMYASFLENEVQQFKSRDTARLVSG